MHVFLASRSPQRLKLLRDAGFDVELVATEVAEPPPEFFPTPDSYVLCTAVLKAADASRRVARGLIVAADTMTEVHGEVLGKPRDRTDAQRMLRLLSGTQHRVLSGLCLCSMPEGIYLAAVESTTLVMHALTEDQLEAYLESGSWREKAGAYAIQEMEDPFVEIAQGSLSNVIGLPLERLEALLRQFAPRLEARR